jgi:hypothetical protein
VVDSVREVAKTGPVGRRGLKSAVMVSVAGDSVEKVAFSNGQRRVQMQTRLIKETDVELVGLWFFPKSCRVEIEFTDVHAAITDGAGHAAPFQALGTVSKVQLCGHEPTYSIWVHLDEIRPSKQDWQAVLAQDPDGAPASEV